MNCDTARQRISASLDGEMRNGAAADLETHLLDCAACRTERDEMRSDMALLSRSLPSFSRDLPDRILHTLPDAPTPASPVARIIRIGRSRHGLATAAAVVLFGLAILFVFPEKTDPNGEGALARGDEIGELEGRSLFVVRTDGERKVLSEWTPIHEGDIFENDDVIPARLKLHSGAELALAEDTKAQVQRVAPEASAGDTASDSAAAPALETVVRMIGEGELVAMVDASSAPFVVKGVYQGDPVSVRALGTVFSVLIEENLLQVRVFEGAVLLRHMRDGQAWVSEIRGGEGWVNGEISTEELVLPRWALPALPALSQFEDPIPASLEPMTSPSSGTAKPTEGGEGDPHTYTHLDEAPIETPDGGVDQPLGRTEKRADEDDE